MRSTVDLGGQLPADSICVEPGGGPTDGGAWAAIVTRESARQRIDVCG
jgi:hypothetical protein